MSNTPTLKLKGASGREYAFLVYPWGTEFKPVGAVYAATRCNSNTGEGTHSIVYIGQTGDLSQRFDNHHKLELYATTWGELHLCASGSKRTGTARYRGRSRCGV